MGTLVIRDLDDDVKARLRVRAAHNGRSMEAEARAILGDALAEPALPGGLGSRINRRFADLDDDIDGDIGIGGGIDGHGDIGIDGGIKGHRDFARPPRSEPPRPADFDS